jgi:hypothetical protein
MKRRRAFLPVLVVGFSSLLGCGGAGLSAPARRAAEKGDLATLRNEIAQGERDARLSLGQTAELARAVASREVLAAPPDAAILRVRELRACAPEVESALVSRMKTHDTAGAEAALALLDAQRLGEWDVRSFVASDNDEWRAVGVRSLTRAEDRALRIQAVLDPSPKVRRAALHAVMETRDPADASAAFEAARGDPDPMVRTDAVRAMGLLARAGADVANRLRDLYATADDPLREDIGAAWASPAVFPSGGREALIVLLAQDMGSGALSAAGAVLREPEIHDAEVEAAARAALARAIASGSHRRRLHAIAVTPLAPKPHEPASDVANVIAAIREAAQDEDLDVRISALERLAGEEAPSADRGEAVKSLEALAGRTDDEPLASRARLALAHAGDVRVQAWIERDLTSTDARVRLAAVDALIALGRASRGAPVLADPDVSVRTRGACALLLAARLGR